MKRTDEEILADLRNEVAQLNVAELDGTNLFAIEDRRNNLVKYAKEYCEKHFKSI